MFALFFIKQIKSSFVAFFVCGCVSFHEFSLFHAIVSFYFLHTASPIDECAHTRPRTHTCDIRCCCWGQKWLKFRICEFECGAVLENANKLKVWMEWMEWMDEQWNANRQNTNREKQRKTERNKNSNFWQHIFRLFRINYNHISEQLFCIKLHGVCVCVFVRVRQRSHHCRRRRRRSAEWWQRTHICRGS